MRITLKNEFKKDLLNCISQKEVSILEKKLINEVLKDIIVNSSFKNGSYIINDFSVICRVKNNLNSIDIEVLECWSYENDFNVLNLD